MQFGTNDSYFNFVHEETNIKLGGGLDDVFLNCETGQYHIIDYKSTAQGTRSPEKYQKRPVSINEPWKVSYKRQMDMYVWIMQNKGFDVSNTGYFVYVDAQHKDIQGMLRGRDTSKAGMEFAVSIIPYLANTSWIEPTLREIKEFLINQSTCPSHEPRGDSFSGCDLGRYAEEMMAAIRS